MKCIRYVIPIFFVAFGMSMPISSKILADEPVVDTVSASPTVQASDTVKTSEAVKASDEEALRSYVKKMRAITVKEKGGNLVISGDVKLAWHHLTAKNDDRYQRGWESRKLAPNDVIQSRHVDLVAWHEAQKKVKDDWQAAKKARLKAIENNKDSKKEKQHVRSLDAINREYKKKYRKTKIDYRGRRNARVPPFGKNEFNVEANLVFDYRADRGWSTIQVQFDNKAGTKTIDRKALVTDNRRIMFGSGQTDQIALKQAYAGYNVWSEGLSRFDVEIGRRKMYTIFDSKIEFDNYFDGVYGRYTTTKEGLADFSLKAGAFVIDSTVNHYGYVGEAAMMNILDSGTDLKYSLVDWELHHHNRFGLRHPLGTRFVNSQFLWNYSMPESVWSWKPRFYAAYLVNSAAKPNHWTHGKRANEAYYFGTAKGEIKKKGDWAYEILYQWVQAQAIPENDVRDAGRDNPRKISFYNRRSGGFANYKGWKLDFFYALTDNWTIHPFYENEKQVNKSIGGKHHSTEFTIETIFAF